VNGIGFQRMIKKHNYFVYLIGEFRTSKCCPKYHNMNLEIFKRLDSRPQTYH
ncbi:uncharacterized protein BX663DRAFT_425769, partial [Cokeromyces recurvatus]|uniref:uncharacterized protein n=1 Tax=Cokeromyces recurvatus TaxID=90255 RepID=UPI002220929B